MYLMCLIVLFNSIFKIYSYKLRPILFNIFASLYAICTGELNKLSYFHSDPISYVLPSILSWIIWK